jgi:peptidoglycan hydrolase CwlO-like protein
MNEKNLKNIMVALVAAVVVLAGVLAVVWYKNSEMIKELELDKDALTQEMIQLQNDYATLSSDYDEINHQLDSSREEVSQLIEKLVKTEARNRSKIRQYEKELGTLRTIMKSYIVQIDSLNTLNKKLTADAAAARKEAAESKKKSEMLSKTVEALEGQVATGAVIKARGIALNAYNQSDKVTDRSSRVTYMMTTLSLVENALAEKGPVRVYLRLLGPDSVLLTGEAPVNFTVAGEPMLGTASREVDYQGAEVDMSIYINKIPEFAKGHYVVEAYTEQGLLGTSELMLR